MTSQIKVGDKVRALYDITTTIRKGDIHTVLWAGIYGNYNKLALGVTNKSPQYWADRFVKINSSAITDILEKIPD